MVAEHKIDRQKLISGHKSGADGDSNGLPAYGRKRRTCFYGGYHRNADAIRGISGTPVVYNVHNGDGTRNR